MLRLVAAQLAIALPERLGAASQPLALYCHDPFVVRPNKVSKGTGSRVLGPVLDMCWAPVLQSVLLTLCRRPDGPVAGLPDLGM